MNVATLAFLAAKYAALLLIPYFLVFAVRRVYFHPLSKYPGPLLAKLSDAYGGFYAILMRLHLATDRDLKTYGPVIRHGPNKLVFSSAEALRDIYTNERMTKSHVYLLTSAPGNTSIFNTIEKRQHSIKRRLIGQAVNDKAMRDFEPTMTQQIDVFIDQLREASESGAPIDMSQRIKRLGMDIVGQLAFGFPLHMQTDETYRFMNHGLNVGGYRAHCVMQFPLIKKTGFEHLLAFASRGQRDKYVQMMKRMIGTRLSEDKHARHDLYSVVVDHLDDPANGITTSQLWSEALFFFPAGGETTATALSALFFYLARNPDVYKTLAQEIRTTFTSAAEIHGGPKLNSCRYLRACIDETLRITPPVSGTLWRELYADEAATGESLVVDGHVVPPGTEVGVCTYTLHHDPTYFPEPYAFKPERWLDETEAMRLAFAPFSVGPRSCAGKAMAYLEASLVVARTMWSFDFERAPGRTKKTGGGNKKNWWWGRRREDEFQLYDIFAAMHVGPELVFTKRG